MDSEVIEGLQTMTKDELIGFSANALEVIERLEVLNTQFKHDLEASGSISPEIIWQWREWLGIMDKERDNWATLATKISEENRILKNENERLFERCTSVLQVLDRISVFSNVQVDGNKPPSFLVGVIQKIRKAISDSKSALLEFVIDEPIIETQTPALPPSADPATEQQPHA
jgi:hypothetical protein